MAALPRPNLKPRRRLLWILAAIFAAWVGLLVWVYVTQILMKR